MCALMNSSAPYNIICQFLTLPKAPTWSTQQVPINEPFIDYNKNITMTSKHYVIKLEQKLQCKEAITIERDWRKWWLNQKSQEKMKKLEERLPSAITLMKGPWIFFDETWSTKQCAKVGETLHSTIWTNAPFLSIGYKALFYMTTSNCCKFNMKAATWKNEKPRRKVEIICILFWLSQHGSIDPIFIMFLSNDYWNNFDNDGDH